MRIPKDLGLALGLMRNSIRDSAEQEILLFIRRNAEMLRDKSGRVKGTSAHSLQDQATALENIAMKIETRLRV